MDFDAQKIDELLELTRENNKILNSMRRTQRLSSFLTFVYWILILGSIFGVYYYLQPTVTKYLGTLQKATSLIQNIESKAGAIPTDLKTFKDLLGK